MADAAGCAIVNARGEIMLVHQTYGERLWEVPGGIVEPGESAWDAAARECREEIGAKPEGLALCGMYFLPKRDAYVFIFRVDALLGTPAPDLREVDDWAYFAPDQLPDLISPFTRERLRDALGPPGLHLRVQREAEDAT